MKLINQRIGLILGMIAAIALTAGAMIAATAQAAPAIVGDAAPDFSVVDSEGNIRTLDEFAGQRVILEWTNHGCPFVKKHYSEPRTNMQSLQSDYGSLENTVWLSVISSAPGKQGYFEADEANAHATTVGASPDAILLDPDGVMGKSYGAQTTPHMFIIDSDENQTLIYNGAIDNKPTANPAHIDSATNYIISGFEKLAAGEAIDPGTTKSYGCTVKYAS
ncbi:MAG: thioredoxin family protein [Ponticaulis sp.]|nr:thioredoxin family protein [Ponticaulis sp.]|tara:strand:+ start:5562 stop:6221 length:660 start_codon:yes stop_codon:yes gene_type:complete